MLKKSTLTFLCCLSLFFGTPHAQGKAPTFGQKLLLAYSLCATTYCLYEAFTGLEISNNIKKYYYKKTSSRTPQKIHAFANKCYKAMAQFSSDFSHLPREKIDTFVTKNNILNEGIYVRTMKQGGENHARFILLNKTVYPNLDETTDLTSTQKNIICHEVAHSWLGHDLKNRPNITGRQVEFEAETLNIKTLYSLGEIDALHESFVSFIPSLNDPLESAYLFGALNGASCIDDAKFKKEFSEWLVQILSICEKSPTFENPLEIDYIRSTCKLSEHWEPIRTYQEALSFVNTTLKTNYKAPFEPIMNHYRKILYGLTTVSLAATIHKFYKFFSQK